MDFVSVDSIKLNDHNPRIIKDNKFKQLVKSIKDFPQMLELRPIVVNDEMMVLGGNMRLKACIEAGLAQVPVLKASQLSPEQQQEFIIKDNVGFGEWDWDTIANQWDAEQVMEWGLDIPGFALNQEATEDNYEVPDEIETDIKLGDLFQIGPHRLLCGDSTKADDVERLMDGQKADISFTSPPYNGNTTMYDYVIIDGKKKRKDKPLYAKNDTDNKTSIEYIRFLNEILVLLFDYTEGYIFWNINYNAKSRFEYLESVYPFRYKLQETIIWKKNAIPTANGFTRNFEFIFLFKCNSELRHLNKEYDVTHTIWEVNNSGSQIKNHKACFPVELPGKAIALSDATKSVLDVFIGSGTTMVAAHQLHRKCYGMEIDPKYCQVIIDRMRKLDPTIEIIKNGQLIENKLLIAV